LGSQGGEILPKRKFRVKQEPFQGRRLRATRKESETAFVQLDGKVSSGGDPYRSQGIRGLRENGDKFICAKSDVSR